MIKEEHENLITGKTFEVVILIRRFLELLNSHNYFCFLITHITYAHIPYAMRKQIL